MSPWSHFDSTHGPHNRPADEYHDTGTDEQSLPDRVREERIDERTIHHKQKRQEPEWQPGQDHRRQSLLGGERIHLAAQVESLAERVADRVEDLGKIATDLVLDADDDGDKVVVRVGSAHGEPSNGVCEMDANRNLPRRLRKLRSGRLRAMSRNESDCLRNAVSSPQTLREELQSIQRLRLDTSAAT